MLDLGGFGSFDHSESLEPFVNALGILANRRVRTAVEERVIGVRIDMHLAGNSHFAELTIAHDRRH